MARTTATVEQDNYMSRLVKLVPAEIITAYLFLFNQIKGNGYNADNNPTLQWIVFALVLTVTPFYLYKVAGIRLVSQIVICTVSFVVWVVCIGGPLDGRTLGGYPPQFIGSLILPVYTLVIPWFYKPAATN